MNEGPTLRFESYMFTPSTHDDPETNPDMYAKAAAEWMSGELDKRGVQTIGVFSEDFAWCVGVSRNPRELYVACSTTHGTNHAFEITYFSVGSLLSGIFGRKKSESNLVDLNRCVKEILQSSQNIKWIGEVHAR